MPIEIADATRDDVVPLRHQVLRPTMPFTSSHFATDQEYGVRHFKALYGGLEIVGVATSSPSEPPEYAQLPATAGRLLWRIRGMAVDPGYRNQGIGRKLLTSCVKAAQDAGADAVWANVRVGAQSLYHREGFSVEGDVFRLPDIGDHIVMWKKLSGQKARKRPKNLPR